MKPMAPDQFSDTDSFVTTLPDPESALLFRKKLFDLGGRNAQRLIKNPVLLSRLILINSYSPFLGDALLRNPEYISWLEEQTGGKLDRVKTSEQMAEDLARLAARSGAGAETSVAAGFKMREMIRIYLRDCAGIATLSEVTEELSNLADVILQYVLKLALTEEEKVHGAPMTRDERGRSANAEMVIVGLGKLGCRELNYASDVDLLFVYTGKGHTSGSPSEVGNKDFFERVAGRVVKTVGSRHESSGGTPIYRIDLRLRPYGRDGDLVWEAARAADYYRTKAQNWERQALIRARGAAGAEAAFETFWRMVSGSIFRADVLPGSVADVRRAKEKIDRREAGKAGGFNVKLGVGGIREIEFIAQALQLEHGGREPWVRTAQTLILLARLAEKSLLSETERTQMSAAYTFLRTVEHRLQMEHGAQTHSLPAARERLTLLAQRCGYLGSTDPASDFIKDLEMHTRNVRTIFNNVLGDKGGDRALQRESHSGHEPDHGLSRLIRHAALSLQRLVSRGSDPLPGLEWLTQTIAAAVEQAVNPLRSARGLATWAASMDSQIKSGEADPSLVGGAEAGLLIHRAATVLSSQYLSRIVVTPALLAESIITYESKLRYDAEGFAIELMSAIDPAAAPAASADVLRRAHHRRELQIVLHDMQQAGAKREASWAALRTSNRAQTALAEAVLRVASGIALSSVAANEAERRALQFAVMGLGRLGHAGMDHGSDLDLIILYDGEAPDREQSARSSDLYMNFASTLIRILSTVTREGFLYPVDMRLRPEGKNGSVAQSLAGLLAYVRTRASAWEHSAYLKAREVAGSSEFGQRSKAALVEAVFDAASRNRSLKEELSAMRDRLVKEKARGKRGNIKWGPGGMTDVYFVTRYLQLRDRIYLGPELGTIALIQHLGERGSLGSDHCKALFEGYRLLRMLDHWMRLLLDQPRPELPSSQTALVDITRAMGLDSISELERELRERTSLIEGVFNEVFGV